MPERSMYKHHSIYLYLGSEWVMSRECLDFGRLLPHPYRYATPLAKSNYLRYDVIAWACGIERFSLAMYFRNKKENQMTANQENFSFNKNSAITVDW